MGILDMTGFKEKAHLHTLGMVVVGVGAIQREFQLQAMYQKISLSHQYVLEMMESLPFGIILVNPEGKITSINHKACEMLKAPAENFQNQNIFEKIGQIDCLQRALKHGKEIEETEYYFENGEQSLHFTFYCRPIKTKKNVFDGAVIILREIDAVRRITGKMAGYKARFTFNDLIGEDPLFKNVITQARTVATTLSNILILGESGTGKEVLAQAIHNASNVSKGPFVAISCGVLPRELISSELFGYEEGAFTGAKKSGNPGKFELANNGTIFLDEIGDMPLNLQFILLRVLQERVVVRLGGQREIPVNVRLIAATNKDLQQMVSDGLFRQDLYYRLNVISLLLPPLRLRAGDIPILASYFINNQSKKMGRGYVALSPLALDQLEHYSWPGNIRELENVLERVLIFSNGSEQQIGSISNIIDGKRASDNLLGKKEDNILSLKYSEKVLIKEILTRCDGNISLAAQALGITRATLYRKLQKYSILEIGKKTIRQV
jgi:transcriptional regulator with PAS, ATPase and Fis domain